MSTTEAPSAPPAAVVSNEAVVKSEPPAPQSGDNAAAESKNDATETVKEEIPVQNTDSIPKPDSAPADPKPEISVADSKQAGEAAEKSQEVDSKFTLTSHTQYLVVYSYSLRLRLTVRRSTIDKRTELTTS